MTEFKGYDSLEEMWEDMDAAKKEADTKIQPGQAELTWGDHWLREEPAFKILIYGEVTRSPYPEDGPVEEHAMKNGFVVGNCYSVLCSEGECGNTHRATINAKLTKEQFEIARRYGWPRTLDELAKVLFKEALQ